MSATVRVPQLCLASAQPRVPCAEGRCRPALAEPTENVVRPKRRSNCQIRGSVRPLRLFARRLPS